MNEMTSRIFLWCLVILPTQQFGEDAQFTRPILT